MEIFLHPSILQTDCWKYFFLKIISAPAPGLKKLAPQHCNYSLFIVYYYLPSYSKGEVAKKADLVKCFEELAGDQTEICKIILAKENGVELH